MVQKEAWFIELCAHYSDRVPGGLADQMTPEDFDPAQLHKGIRTEMEHTDDPELAQEIAMDHLMEDPEYYDLLELIEARVAGEDLTDSEGDEEGARVPANPQAYYVWLIEELHSVVKSGVPANLGGRQITPAQAKSMLYYLESTPVQKAQAWIRKLFPARYEVYTDQ